MSPKDSFHWNGSDDETWEGNKRGWRCNCLQTRPDAVDISDALVGARIYNFETGEYGDPWFMK